MSAEIMCPKCKQLVATKIGPDGVRRYAHHNVGPMKRMLCSLAYDFAPEPSPK